jgi:hypothetical protein
VHRKLFFAIRVLNDGYYFVIDEIANRLPDHQLVFAKERVDVHVVDTGEAGHEGGL